MIVFAIESWSWYGAVLVMVCARLLLRAWHFQSLEKLKTEDGLMVLLSVFYTILIVFLNIDHHVSTNLIDPSKPIELTESEIHERTYGSKTVLLVEQCMCAVQWGCKICMLLLYQQLTFNLREHVVVKVAIIYVGVTYITMQILYFAVWCRPFHDYWAVPTRNLQCSATINHLITNLTGNLSSDLLILAIPLPLLLRQNLPLKKKLLLVFPFMFGFLTIASAIASKHTSFTHPYSPVWVYWYCREASITMIVCNMPYVWGLIRKIFNLHSLIVNGADQFSNVNGRYTNRGPDGNTPTHLHLSLSLVDSHTDVQYIDGQALSLASTHTSQPGHGGMIGGAKRYWKSFVTGGFPV